MLREVDDPNGKQSPLARAQAMIAEKINSQNINLKIHSVLDPNILFDRDSLARSTFFRDDMRQHHHHHQCECDDENYVIRKFHALK